MYILAFFFSFVDSTLAPDSSSLFREKMKGSRGHCWGLLLLWGNAKMDNFAWIVVVFSLSLPFGSVLPAQHPLCILYCLEVNCYICVQCVSKGEKKVTPTPSSRRRLLQGEGGMHAIPLLHSLLLLLFSFLLLTSPPLPPPPCCRKTVVCVIFPVG